MTRPWLQTYSSRVVEFPMSVDMVNVRDIAHSLSNQCRYSGHTDRHYSVAEHSVHLANHFLRENRPELARAALLHDAGEAYVVDLPRPLKRLLPEYVKLCDEVDAVISAWAGFDIYPTEVKDADYRICLDERDQAMGTPPKDWEIQGAPLGVALKFWTPREAEVRFLEMYRFLFEE